jgi:hypothetical protein
MIETSQSRHFPPLDRDEQKSLPPSRNELGSFLRWKEAATFTAEIASMRSACKQKARDHPSGAEEAREWEKLGRLNRSSSSSSSSSSRREDHRPPL